MSIKSASRKAARLNCLSLLLALSWSPSMYAASVYDNNFESSVGPSLAITSGGGSLGIEFDAGSGRRFLGLADSLPNGGLGNQTVTLSLSSLPAHSSITVSFDFYAMRSMDGGFNCCGPDLFRFSLGGYQRTTSVGGPTQAFPAFLEPSGAAGGTASSNPTYSDTTNFWRGVSAPMSFTIPHYGLNGSTANVQFAMSDLQDVFDEGWGIDNLKVTADDLVSTCSSPDGVICGSGPYLRAQFQPNRGLDYAASLGGYTHYNWIQIKRRAPSPVLALRTPYVDPPINGADASWAPLGQQWADDRYFYWDEFSQPIFDTRPWGSSGLLANNTTPSTLVLLDAPADPYASAASTIDFVTALVGVRSPINWDILDLFSWSSDGTATRVTGRNTDASGITGGIVSINDAFSIADLSPAEIELLRSAGAQNLLAPSAAPEPGSLSLLLLPLAFLMRRRRA